jgi:3-oxoacyl-[acyl-carrier protein] reductase
MTRASHRVALVTGSSRGLGRAIAVRLGRDGYAVAINALRGDVDAAAVVATIRAAGGIADAFLGDVTDEPAVQAMTTQIAAQLGPVDVLVCNATGPQPDFALTDTGWSEHLDQLRFFVASPVAVGRAVVDGMRDRGWGRIVQIDSEVIDRVPLGRSAYVTAKSAQLGLMRSWAAELAPHGITVNAVGPGFVPVERHAEVAPAVLADYVAGVPAGRLGSAEDVAHAVSFFVSEEASFITGQRLVVDGGRGVL